MVVKESRSPVTASDIELPPVMADKTSHDNDNDNDNGNDKE